MMTQQNVCDERELAKSERRHHVLPLVTCLQIYAQKLIGHKFFVELVSKQVEIQNDRAVPVSTQTIDVVVTQPAESALAKLNKVIAQLIATCEWLKDYSVVSYSKLSFDQAPF
ncbi:MAG: hypothetical protein CLLPBCKN_006158 [Chroococcidiopsis cubana SAG 39.79]|uniref:Uncharacterized protein n=1 Tax=Chroococcidiopsis cubana SAG 39.79 TaxID=388085 RepID=A0AB37UGY8_9CYAN|nr:hypothetical protein [Chroococcidiopsis cubana]MDZ4876723.1 hypothetical protein [Chroococcidiopsis cubana SAG 39.79]PSB65938.1 hypothetical protein C7B79_03120 [Chroococcidiopsis cubana CCALA 043]RUT10566.1 hypothetical protein DSM107010_41330 [Chroococcidiopsis cubana SAG 39.79]